MCDSSNLHNEHVCSCANHNLPTYEEAVGSAPSVETAEIHTIFTTPKTVTNHDRQHPSINSQQPSVQFSRTTNSHYTNRPSYRVYNSYRTPSYNRPRYAPTGNTLTNVNRTRPYDAVDPSRPRNQKSNTPCQSSVAIAAFFVLLMFVALVIIMKGYSYLHRKFTELPEETTTGD